MCGIVGVVAAGLPEGQDPSPQLQALLELSESRGSEAAGLAVVDGAGLHVEKSARAASEFVRAAPFRSVAAQAARTGLVAAIGHTRMVTNGSAIYADNNQPVVCDDLAMVHNGIITNPDDLWDESGRAADQRVEVDSAALLAFVARRRREGEGTAAAVAAAFGLLNGSASICIVSELDGELVLATNNGSLYVGYDAAGRFVTFGSERPFLEDFRESKAATVMPAIACIEQLPPGSGLTVDASTAEVSGFSLEPYVLRRGDHPSVAAKVRAEVGSAPSVHESDWHRSLRRCTRCVLPETFPFIDFDGDGVCSECRSYVPVSADGDDALEEILSRFRSADGTPDCILAFSGGRDSAFGLHRLVRDFGMTPLTLTYDWGMVTDLARRNQARLGGALGVEHVLVSADIAAKRRNIGRNLRAWLAQPDLGLVPLLMAGDKHFFVHSQRLAKRTGVKLVVFCTNPLEMTYFKSGFAGVRGQRYYTGNVVNKARLAGYYARRFVTNPRYLNRSLLDTATAFRASYLSPHDYVQLYEHITWDEDEINDLLIDEYAWETDPSTPTTWRIGDGTAPFYNWVYYEAAGFTENDTFRSNQIREGYLARDRALELVRVENRPRWDRIREYLDLVDVPFELAELGVAQLVGRRETLLQGAA